MSGLFTVDHLPFLLAVGDDIQLKVSRSRAVSVSDPRYLAVLRYVEDHGMVLVDRKVGPEEGMFGRAEQSRYATPEARMLLMMNTAEETNA